MRFKILIPVLLLFLAISIQAKCHYSCNNCTAQLYTSCSSCPNNSNFTYVLSLNPNSGACAQVPTRQANVFGIILLISIICLLPMFLEQQMVQLFLFIQTLGLCFLVQIYNNPILDYALSGCTYLMIISPMTHSYKSVPLGVHINILKGRVFFSSFSFTSNIIVIGCINLTLFLTLVLLPIFKNIRKKCVDERVQFCPDWLIQKIQLASSIAFIFFIQQTVSVIYFSLKYDEFSISGILISILYFLILVAFTINQFFYPLHIFRNKFVQTSTIIGKTVIPMFLLSSADQHFVLFPLAITFSIVNTIATNKNKNKGKFNRLLLYNILGIIILCLFTCLYVIEGVSNNAQTSQRLGIVCLVGLFGVLSCVILEVVLKIKQKVCNQTLLTESRKQERDTTLQTIEVYNQKQQKARNFSPTLYLEENKQELSPNKHFSNADSIVPEASEHFSPQVERSNGPSIKREIESKNKYQTVNVQQSISLKKEEPQQQFQQIQYGAYLPTHTEIINTENTEKKDLQDGSQIIVGASSKNTKRLAKIRKDKKSSK